MCIRDVSLDQVLAADDRVLGVERPSGAIAAIHLCRGTRAARGTPRAATTRLPSSCSANSTRTASCWSTTISALVRSSRYGFVPPGKIVVLGLVTTKTDVLESQTEILRRIDAAARYVPLEQLALSPQCGFASLMEGNRISPDTQWRKLELVVETARRVWG